MEMAQQTDRTLTVLGKVISEQCASTWHHVSVTSHRGEHLSTFMLCAKTVSESMQEQAIIMGRTALKGNLRNGKAPLAAWI
jgi:hypothetical protein